MTRIAAWDSNAGDPSLLPIVSSDRGGKIGFRIKFNVPVYLILSHPICKFRSQRNYPLPEPYFVANLGLVPVFLPSLNRMTVLKLWGNNTTQFFNPSNMPLPEKETVCWKFPVSNRAVEFSSMNFIEQNGSDPELEGKYLSDIFLKYFTWLYWVFPSKGFSSSCHMLYGRTKLSAIIKISKSLYQVEEIENPQCVIIEGRQVQTLQVVVKALSENNGQYFFKRISALMDTELAYEILGNDNLETAFVNGIVSEIRLTGGRKHSLLTVKADYALSRFDVIQFLIGMVSSRRIHASDSISDIGTINEIREEVGNILYSIEREMKIPFTVSDMVENLFETCIDYMFPVLLKQNNRIKVVHPVIWGFLAHWNLLKPDNRTEQEDIILKILSIMESKKSNMGLYLSEECEALRKYGIDKDKILRSIHSLRRLINTCKEIDRIFGDDMSE